MDKELRWMTLILLGLAAIAYLGGIVWAGIASLDNPEEPTLPGIVIQAVTVIGSILSVHTGAVFGIAKYVNGSSTVKPSIFKPQTWAILPAKAKSNPNPTLDMIQKVAVYVYIVSLITAIVFWGVDDGFSSKSSEILINMSYTFIGLLGGLLAVSLNVDNI